MISVKEAQELHELIGVAMLAQSIELPRKALTRARELASIVVTDAECGDALTKAARRLIERAEWGDPSGHESPLGPDYGKQRQVIVRDEDMDALNAAVGSA